MTDSCLCRDFELRGRVFEIWNDAYGRRLVDPRKNEDVDTGRAFDPSLSNEELLSIYDYGKGF